MSKYIHACIRITSYIIQIEWWYLAAGPFGTCAYYYTKPELCGQGGECFQTLDTHKRANMAVEFGWNSYTVDLDCIWPDYPSPSAYNV
jgi:hypothetical protein